MTQPNPSTSHEEYNGTLVVPFELLETVAKRNHAEYRYPKQETAYIRFGSTQGQLHGTLSIISNSTYFPNGRPFLVTAYQLIGGEELTESLPDLLRYPSYSQERVQFREAHSDNNMEGFWTEEREDEFDQFWETHIMKEWRSRVRQNVDVFESNGKRYRVEVVEGDE
jgi:hypothetical protein